jgi:peptide/nickel transport system permease protein
MNSYFIRRMLQMIPMLLFISVVSFLVMHFAPGDPVAMYSNPSKRQITDEERLAIRKRLGLDKPVFVQYFYWLANTLQGDMGYSFKSRAPVTEEIFARLPNTVLLAGSARLLTLVLAIPIGVLTAIRHNSAFDYFFSVLAFIGISMPGFWFALILIEIFSNQLGLLPPIGMQTLGQNLTPTQHTLDILKHLIMPAIAMGVVEIAYWARYQRSSLLEVLNLDYVRTARAKGLQEKVVLWKHAFRNSLIPMITLIGLTLPDLVNGSYIIETIFGWPGIGRLGVTAILQRDYPIVMGVTMLSALLVVAGNLLADLFYAIADPRIQQS